MNDGLRAGTMAVHGTMLMLLCSLMPMGSPVAQGQPVPPPPAPIEPVPVQPVPPQPGSGQRSPAMTPTEAERAREAERLRQAERARAAEPRIERKVLRPSETYLAGFGGYTFGGKISDVEGTGFLSGLNLNDRDLADAGVYGGKLGHFFGDRMDWLGVEMEAFNTTPHVEQQGLLPGSHFRVTTLAFNLIGRLKFGCETKTLRTETRTEKRPRSERYAMKPDMSGSSAGCNPMAGSGSASSLRICRTMATACPTMPCRVSMPWRGCAITSPNVSHCLVNTNTTGRRSN